MKTNHFSKGQFNSVKQIVTMCVKFYFMIFLIITRTIFTVRFNRLQRSVDLMYFGVKYGYKWVRVRFTHTQNQSFLIV